MASNYPEQPLLSKQLVCADELEEQEPAPPFVSEFGLESAVHKVSQSKSQSGQKS